MKINHSALVIKHPKILHFPLCVRALVYVCVCSFIPCRSAAFVKRCHLLVSSVMYRTKTAAVLNITVPQHTRTRARQSPACNWYSTVLNKNIRGFYTETHCFWLNLPLRVVFMLQYNQLWFLIKQCIFVYRAIPYGKNVRFPKLF